MKMQRCIEALASSKLPFAIALCFAVQYAQAQPAGAGESPGQPPMVRGVKVEPLANHQVPETLKSQARSEIDQVRTQGYVDVPDEVVSYLDRAVAAAQATGEGRLRPIQEIPGGLKLSPASLQGTVLEKARFLGAAPAGAYSKEGWSGLVRVFVAARIGPVVLEEFDFVAGEGGLVMIEEAINESVNGRPAILRTKKGAGGKSMTELTWASDRKIYTLRAKSTDNPRSAGELVALARGIVD